DHVLQVTPLNQNARHSVTVPSVSIDALVQSIQPDANEALVIKLDVEGSEIQALQGALATIRSHDVLVAYECHGSDSDCSVSRYVMKTLGLAVFASARRMQFRQLHSIQ